MNEFELFKAMPPNIGLHLREVKRVLPERRTRWVQKVQTTGVRSENATFLGNLPEGVLSSFDPD
jgi:hypothetical protein